MARLSERLQVKVFDVKLSKGFAVESSSSQLAARYCLMRNGIEMTDWMPRDDMVDILQEAVETKLSAVFDALLI
jgi:hypothetical protein